MPVASIAEFCSLKHSEMKECEVEGLRFESKCLAASMLFFIDDWKEQLLMTSVYE